MGEAAAAVLRLWVHALSCHVPPTAPPSCSPAPHLRDLATRLATPLQKFPSLQHVVWAAQWQQYLLGLRAALRRPALVVPVMEGAVMEGEHGVKVEVVLPRAEALRGMDRVELDMALGCPGTTDAGALPACLGWVAWGGGCAWGQVGAVPASAAWLPGMRVGVGGVGGQWLLCLLHQGPWLGRVLGRLFPVGPLVSSGCQQTSGSQRLLCFKVA